MIGEERFENIKASVQKYLDTNWRVGGNLITPIEWPDSLFSAATINEWIQPVLGVAARDFKRQTSPGRQGARLSLMLNININLKREFVEKLKPNRKAQLRDLLVSIFKENTAIAFSDYVVNPATPPSLGVIQCFDVKDTNLPMDSSRGLYMHNVTAMMFCQEEHVAWALTI